MTKGLNHDQASVPRMGMCPIHRVQVGLIQKAHRQVQCDIYRGKYCL